MSQKLYVGNLPYTINSDQLRDLFAQAGSVVSADVLIDRMTGRSRGFGFVEMASEEDGQKAIEMFNEKDYEGRNLVVNVARPKEDRPRSDNFERRDRDRGGNRGGSSGGYRDNRR